MQIHKLNTFIHCRPHGLLHLFLFNNIHKIKMKGFIILAIFTLGLTSALPTVDDKVTPQEERRYVVVCSHLPNGDLKADDGSVDPMDVSDPFLVISDMHGTQIYRSETVDNNDSPVFQWSLNWSEDQVYTFELRDHDAFAPDDTLGTVSVAAANLERIHNLANPSGGNIQLIKL